MSLHALTTKMMKNNLKFQLTLTTLSKMILLLQHIAKETAALISAIKLFHMVFLAFLSLS